MGDESVRIEPSEAHLAAAVEENLFALFRSISTAFGGDVEESERFGRHSTSLSNPMFNGVWRTRLSRGEVETAIDDVDAWFRQRDAPYAFWWTGPETSPSDLGERLEARGLISMEGQSRELAPGIESGAAGAPCLAADLRRMNDDVLEQVPAGFTIEEIRDEASLREFKQVLLEGYEMPEWAAQSWVDAALRAGIGNTPWRMYLGRLNGEPVASNMLFNGGGVASVYGVATVPAARGQGIGAAITLKPLLDARDEGYQHAALFSTDMAVRVYERIGFRDTGARINRYLWRRES